MIYSGLGERIFVHGCAATPNLLVEALVEHGKESNLHNVEVIHIHTEGPALYAQPDCEGMDQELYFYVVSLRCGRTHTCTCEQLLQNYKAQRHAGFF